MRDSHVLCEPAKVGADRLSNLSENACRRIGQPVEKLLAEFLRENLSLTAQSFF
jgi:hypothetical protein